MMYRATPELKKIRRELGRQGVKDLSERLGYDWSHFYWLVRNEFRPSQAIATAAILNRPLDELFELVEDKEESRVG